ncbi:TetR/AcrR family transcriptional regulator [Novosphingobium sp. EMRT-2]|uniref:TetR/AcrR family transcriptional regulator n=1 Tax=Novosphingobium sp. EMRT-2 TaxID=2571749 RepID=UPI0010BDD44A|nr:TetR/AcrR family transcriptional regulator [Novosphingobium sp. EMRT-2]QCI95760.1 TetR/AcrR family transcriptional regulator [Novosphingobium sp. EMRT-2]
MSSSKQPRRGKGRPVGSGDGVGKETLIAATKKLLQELTPAQVTIAAIAREAGADPALVRYYFGSREALLLEVTQQIALQAEVETRSEDLTPEAGLEDLIHRTFRFTRSARYMQRLMAEELSSVRSPEVREKLRKWQSIPVEAYQALLDADHDKQLTDFSPLFVHLAVIGISDFFHSGEEVVKMLVPEGTDLAALEQEYEAFVPKLLLDGLRRR